MLMVNDDVWISLSLSKNRFLAVPYHHHTIVPSAATSTTTSSSSASSCERQHQQMKPISSLLPPFQIHTTECLEVSYIKVINSIHLMLISTHLTPVLSWRSYLKRSTSGLLHRSEVESDIHPSCWGSNLSAVWVCVCVCLLVIYENK